MRRFLAVLFLMTGLALPVAMAAGADENAFADPDAVHGVLKARHEALISSDLVARIEKIPFREGEKFNAGEAIILFDCRRYVAELDAAAADTRAAKKAYEENVELHSRRAVGATELEISQAKSEQVEASTRALRVRMQQCRINAPFNGRVVEQLVNAHERPSANTPLLRIIGDRDVEIELLVPSAWLRWLKPGAKFDFRIDELGTSHAATVTRLGARVDPVSQTVRVKAELLRMAPDILPGMSGTARFEELNG